MPKPKFPVKPAYPRKDQASYIIVDGKPKRRSVQQAAPTEYGPSVDKYQSNNIYINNNRCFIRYSTNKYSNK